MTEENAFEEAVKIQGGPTTIQQKIDWWKTMTDSKNLEENEKLYLSKLEEINRQSISISNNFLTTMKNQGGWASLQQIEWRINLFKEHEKNCMTFDEWAQYLNKEGRPLLLKRLNEILRDVRWAIKNYQEMYQNRLIYEANIAETNRKAGESTIDIMKGVGDRRQAGFDQVHEQRTRLMIGGPYLTYCQNCRAKIYYYTLPTYCTLCFGRLY